MIFKSTKKHKNPLEEKKLIDNTQLIENLQQNTRILCLGLDKTLVYLQSKKGDPNKSVLLRVKQIDAKNVKMYMTPRPFLKEFLQTVV